MPRDIPVIETRRLILRGPEPGGYPDFKATFTSYRARFMGGPLNPYESWMLYAAEIGHWKIRGFGMWMIHDRQTDETYGMAGGWKPAMWPEAEIAWVIWPDAAGKGFALEATHAARKYFYRHGGWEGAVSYIDPKNLDSIRLAERLGASGHVVAVHGRTDRAGTVATVEAILLANGVPFAVLDGRICTDPAAGGGAVCVFQED